MAEAASVPVVIDLWAPWCGPCRMVSPALEQVAAEMAGQVKLVKVNVDESPRLQRRFGVQAIPTLLVLREGKVVASRAGAGHRRAGMAVHPRLVLHRLRGGSHAIVRTSPAAAAAAFAGNLLHGRGGDLLARKVSSDVGSLTLSVVGWLVPLAAAGDRHGRLVSSGG